MTLYLELMLKVGCPPIGTFLECSWYKWGNTFLKFIKSFISHLIGGQYKINQSIPFGGETCTLSGSFFVPYLQCSIQTFSASSG